MSNAPLPPSPPSTSPKPGPDHEALFRAHWQALFLHLVHQCGDHDLAADVAQEAFIQLVATPPAHGAYLAWLYRVAINRLRSRVRGQRRRWVLLHEHPQLIPRAAPPLDPEAELEQREEAERAQSVLGRLPERDRTLLLLREQGFRYDEIAGVLGVAPGSVGQLIARALRRLARVQGEGDAAGGARGGGMVGISNDGVRR